MARSWLPVGSVVTLEGAVRPIMVAAVMVQDATTGLWWDYMGYPYPEGMSDVETGYFFDASMVREVHQLGFMDSEALGFQLFLQEREQEYLTRHAEGRASGDE